MNFYFAIQSGLCSMNFHTNYSLIILLLTAKPLVWAPSGALQSSPCLGSQCQHSGPKISKTTTEYHKQDVNITLRYHVASSKAEYNASQKSVSSCYKRQIHQIFGPSEKSRFTVYQQIPNCNKGAKFHHRLDMQDSYKSFSFGFATTSW